MNITEVPLQKLHLAWRERAIGKTLDRKRLT